MTWHTPSTWADATTPTSTDFNEQIRDNLTIIGAQRDTVTGKITSASAFTDASGVNLTGIALLASDNSFTAGTQDYSDYTSGARIILPVGADMFGGTAGNKTPGSIWVEGTALHWVDESQNEWYAVGIDEGDTSTPGAFMMGGTSGSWWYIDELGERRRFGTTFVSTETGAAIGSVWVEGVNLHYINHLQQDRYISGAVSVGP